MFIAFVMRCEYFQYVKPGVPIPSVTVSYAQSIDGCIATSSGDSRWISGNETLELAHRLRAEHDAVLVGIGTVLRDDPELSCRLPGAVRSPVRIILDAFLRIPDESRILRTSDSYETVVITHRSPDPVKREAVEASGVRVEEVGTDGAGCIDLREALERLYSLGCRSILVEGGSRVITSFVGSGLVDRMVIVTAPLLIGAGIRSLGEIGTQKLSEAIRPVSSRTFRLGGDIVWELLFGENARAGSGEVAS